MWIIGVTGGIGAGKSTVSNYFRQLDIPIHCDDDIIHFLLDHDKEVHEQVKAWWPDTFVEGNVDRRLLGDRVFSSPYDLGRLEGILYPKLAESQKEFLAHNQKLEKQFVVLDTPLLFEIGLEVYCDYVILVTAPSAVRKQRVLEREGMTDKRYRAIEKLQVKDSIRRKKANFIIYTGRDKIHALKTVQKILFSLSQEPTPKWQGKWPKNFKRSFP